MHVALASKLGFHTGGFRASGCFGGEVGGTDLFRLMADYIL